MSTHDQINPIHTTDNYPHQVRAFQAHAGVFAATTVLIFAVNLSVNLSAGIAGQWLAWWSVWALIGWSFGIAVHGPLLDAWNTSSRSPLRSVRSDLDRATPTGQLGLPDRSNDRSTPTDMGELANTHPGARSGFTVGVKDGDGDGSLVERMYEVGLTDGLPVVPPTEALVSAMLEAGPWDADERLLIETTRDMMVTAYQAAVCAVMAGARPSYFPVIGAALQAMSDRRFFLHGPTTSTGGATIMLVVSGPVADAVGIQGKDNLFGPGFRANATIGRTIRLVQLHCLSAYPGELDRSTQGWPGKFSLCFTEHHELSPWEPHHVAIGYRPDQSTVTVFAAESGHNIVNHGTADPEALLATFADAMAALGSFSPGRSVVVFAPEHAAKLAGLSRRQVQEFLFKHAVRDLATLKRTGKIEDDPTATPDWRGRWAAHGDTTIHPGDDQILVHRGWSADDIMVLVGGGPAGGHSMFFPSWSRGRSVEFVTQEVPS